MLDILANGTDASPGVLVKEATPKDSIRLLPAKLEDSSEQAVDVATAGQNGQLPANNRGLVLHGPHDIRLEDVEFPTAPGPEEVLMRMNYVGICGTDIHLWEEARLSEMWVLQENQTMVIGHEASATVLSVGSSVRHLKAGDHVTMEPATPCDLIECHTCKTGNYNHCDEANLMVAGLPKGNGKDAGLMARVVKRPAAFVFKLPDSIPLTVGAMMEPLAIAVHAIQRCGLRMADNVLVCGAGPMGCLSIMVAKAFGASKILVTDLKEERLAFARAVGADETLLIRPGVKNAENVRQVVNFFGRAPDVALECTGAGPAVDLCIQSCRPGAKVVLVGCGPDMVSVPLTLACLKEIDLLGLCRYRNTFPLAIKLVEENRLPHIHKMITHQVPLSEWHTAFSTMKAGRDATNGNMAVKILLEIN